MKRALLLAFVTACGGAHTPHMGTTPHAPTCPVSREEALFTSDASTWTITGSDPSLYTWTRDPATQAMVLEQKPTSDASAHRRWAATAFTVGAYGFIGKRVRLRIAVKTDETPDGAWIWLRVDSSSPRKLCNLQNPIDSKLRGTRDFTELSCVLDVNEGSSRLVFGIGLLGPGRAFARSARLDVVTDAIAESPHGDLDRVREFASTDAASAGVDAAALARLVSRAEVTHADALVVLAKGKLLGQWFFDKPREPIETMSVTKAIVGLAIGKLVDAGKIASIDLPMSTWFQEWKSDAHKAITLRMILNHTSCLKSAPTTEEIYASKDWVKLALDADLTCTPGSRSFYSNKAVNLLAEVVRIASGKKLDDYVRDELFTPLGIRDFKWQTDPAGHPQCMAGLSLDPLDLAKIGQMLLDGGKWKGAPVISEAWIKAATEDVQPHSTFGLLWWPMTSGTKLSYDDAHLAALRDAGVSATVLKKLEPIRNQPLERAAFLEKLDALLTSDERTAILKANDKVIPKLGSDVAFIPGPRVGFQANGYLGQYLVVLPRDGIVAVRMMRAGNTEGEKLDAMSDFPDLVARLVPH